MSWTECCLLGSVCYGCHLKEGVYIANLLFADQYLFVMYDARKLKHKMSLRRLSEIFIRRIQRDIINVQVSLHKVAVILVEF